MRLEGVDGFRVPDFRNLSLESTIPDGLSARPGKRAFGPPIRLAVWKVYWSADFCGIGRASPLQRDGADDGRPGLAFGIPPRTQPSAKRDMMRQPISVTKESPLAAVQAGRPPITTAAYHLKLQAVRGRRVALRSEQVKWRTAASTVGKAGDYVDGRFDERVTFNPQRRAVICSSRSRRGNRPANEYRRASAALLKAPTTPDSRRKIAMSLARSPCDGSEQAGLRSSHVNWVLPRKPQGQP